MNQQEFDRALQKRKLKPIDVIKCDAKALGLRMRVGKTAITVSNDYCRASVSTPFTSWYVEHAASPSPKLIRYNDYYFEGKGIYSALIYGSVIVRENDDNPEWLYTVLDLFYYPEGYKG